MLKQYEGHGNEPVADEGSIVLMNFIRFEKITNFLRNSD